METLDAKYYELKDTPSEINGHLSTLYNYAKQCNSILSCGNKTIKSDWAFLKGLSKNQLIDSKKLIRVDNERVKEIDFFEAVAKKVNVNYSFIQGNDLLIDVEPVDMVFINSWHVYGHLKRELIKFKDIAKKWIIMHNTVIDAKDGESIRCGFNIKEQALKSGYPIEEITKGLQPAIDEFLVENPEFILEGINISNNGLTVLKRKEASTWSHNPKIGILVLSSPSNNLYLKMKQIWQRYPKRDNISIFFLENYPNIEKTYLDGDTLKIKAEETHIPGIVYKAMEGFKFFRNYDFDYILRTNISSFYVLDVLTETCRNLPKEKCCFAVILSYFDKIVFPFGAGFTLSRDLFQYLADNYDLIDFTLDDDVAIGKFLINETGINIISAPMEIITKQSEIDQLEEKINKRCLHYRVKFDGPDREKYDLPVLERLFKAFYS